MLLSTPTLTPECLPVMLNLGGLSTVKSPLRSKTFFYQRSFPKNVTLTGTNKSCIIPLMRLKIEKDFSGSEFLTRRSKTRLLSSSTFRWLILRISRLFILDSNAMSLILVPNLSFLYRLFWKRTCNPLLTLLALLPSTGLNLIHFP